MYRKFLIVMGLLLTAVALLLCSCAKKVESSGVQAPATDSDGAAVVLASEYMPLNLGNSWTYRRDMLGEKGTLKVSIDRKENGFYVDNQGGMFRLDSIGLRDQSRYLLKNPIYKGSQWRAQVRYNQAERFEILDDAAVVAVPAGTFKNCIIVKSSTILKPGKMMVNRLTYAPHVGMIRAETWIEGENDTRAQQVLLELESYVLP